MLWTLGQRASRSLVGWPISLCWGFNNVIEDGTAWTHASMASLASAWHSLSMLSGVGHDSTSGSQEGAGVEVCPLRRSRRTVLVQVVRKCPSCRSGVCVLDMAYIVNR